MSVARASAAIELVRSHSLTTLVQRELQRQIVSGELEPGAKLSEADVAMQLSVSRGPVREAFRALEQAGLVRTEKNRGVFVREISLAEADEIYEVRAGLDELIGRLVAQRISAEQIERLRELLKKMQQAARAKDVDGYYPLNLRFHDTLAELTGNRALLAVYRRLVNELHLFRRRTLARGVDSFPISTREHGAIIDALAQRDGEQAARLLYDHVTRSRDRLHAAVAQPAPKARNGRRRKAA